MLVHSRPLEAPRYSFLVLQNGGPATFRGSIDRSIDSGWTRDT